MTTWTNRVEPSTDWEDRKLYLATEALLYLVTEDEKKIIVRGIETDYTNRSKPTTNWTNIS